MTDGRRRLVPVKESKAVSFAGARLGKLASLLLLAAALGASSADAQKARGAPSGANVEYVLGPQDRIRLKVLEWRPSRDELFEWAALNAEYTVGAGGKLSLPIVGEVQAGGKTPGELAAAIGVGLRQQIGFIEARHIAVEVVQYRPFYIHGAVEKPGEYAFRPGLTVLQAVAIAGGMQRAEGQGSMRLAREIIAGRGELNLLRLEFLSTIARKARLMAELEGANDIPKSADPAMATADPTFANMLHLESLLFRNRKDGFEAQLTALIQLQGTLEKEAESLAAQLASHDKQMQLMDEELQSVAALYTKQLSTAPRKLALERGVAQLQGERIRLETAIARANQEVKKTEVSILELKNRRLNEITSELRLAQGKLDEVSRKLATAETLFLESRTVSSRTMTSTSDPGQAQPIFTVMRTRSGQTTELPAADASPLEPGDTLRVELPALESDNSWETVKDLPASLELHTIPAKGQRQGSLNPPLHRR